MPNNLNLQTLTFIPRNWNDPILRASAAKALLTQPHHVLFAMGDKGQGGHLLASLMPGAQADILTLFVPDAFRRKGHAKALVEACLKAAKSKGCNGLTLEVSAENKAAIALYSVLGLQQVSTRADYYHDSVSNRKADALVLAVSLA